MEIFNNFSRVAFPAIPCKKSLTECDTCWLQLKSGQFYLLEKKVHYTRWKAVFRDSMLMTLSGDQGS
jgi:hypothetical protein